MRKESEPKTAFASQDAGESPETRKPYQTPRLASYGDLRDLARQTKGGKKGDGGGPSTKV